MSCCLLSPPLDSCTEQDPSVAQEVISGLPGMGKELQTEQDCILFLAVVSSSILELVHTV